MRELAALEYPSSTLALVRVMNNRVDTALFSDTAMALRIGELTIVPTDDRLKKYDEAALMAYQEALAR